METKVSNEREEHMLQVKASKTIRGPFKALQTKANDTMNFAGRVMVYKDGEGKKIDLLCKNSKSENNRGNYVDKGVQAGKKTLATEEERSAKYWRRSAKYWRQLFDMRGKALDKSLEKNQKLQDLYESLQEEQKVCNQMLAESRKLVEVLKEIMREADEEAAE